MGQFAGTLFSLLLGWVQTAVSWLWSLATNADVHAWLRWLLDNWLAVVVLLCIGGVLVDFLVYLIRWQPYRVWRSFLRRLSGKEAETAGDTGDQPLLQRKWVFADGSTEVEEIYRDDSQHLQQEAHLNAPIRPVRRVMRSDLLGQAYHQPVYPPQWQHTTHDVQGENE